MIATFCRLRFYAELSSERSQYGFFSAPMMTFTLDQTECGRAQRVGIVTAAQPLASRLTPVRRETWM
jgi:hypothetical protein